MDAYDVIAEFYDLEFADFDTDVDLYLAFAQRSGDPILEVGCGTGRLLVPLARAGYTVHGVDRSPAMLERARRRLEQEGLTQVRLYQADMVDLHELPDEFYRLVIVALNGFLHLPEREAQQRALRELHRVLRTGGLLVLDVLHPTPEQLRALEQPLAWDGSWQLPDGSRLDRFASRSVQPAEQTITTTLFYDRTDGKTGAVERRVATYTLRYVHRFELELLLETAGFDIEAVYGSYDLEPLSDESPSLLVVAQRRVDSAILARR
ncbi:class I SAM-dependent methyltransferase [Thermomicrobium sp. 4228-Ro]|uniref:class I SAM-dependent methyltransferase n=1 Tax=Thermomicrobium sp. 4228-Ro TaxID=2993937 RepID=UPI00224886AC|nr:class I SAM-dependent methyltransferase [Thermomicrobium sp. 4228-Ro]MCX2727337.1 class I SAM-dependent methyltransferase [Thermomicrobium sp. 4228-Ro]